MKKQDLLENQVNKIVYLSIGTNLGNKLANLEKTKYLIFSDKIKIDKISKIYKSPSWPDRNLPFYLNIVLKIQTSLNPYELLKRLNLIETKMGRKRKHKNEPRICDIDILDYDKMIINQRKHEQKLILPHPLMHKRAFILIPLFDIEKNWFHPKKKVNIGDLFKDLTIKNINSVKELRNQ